MLFGKRLVAFEVCGRNYYVARNKNGEVYLYKGQAPHKDLERGTWRWYKGKTELVGGWKDECGSAFPSVLWSDNFPTKVELFVNCVNK